MNSENFPQPQPLANIPFGLGSIGVAGLLAGPAALGLFSANSFNAFASQRHKAFALGFYVVATIVWIWSMTHVPRDALSQLTIHLPQLLVWQLFTWLVLKKSHSSYAKSGGRFQPFLKALVFSVGAAIAIRLALRLAFSQ